MVENKGTRFCEEVKTCAWVKKKKELAGALFDKYAGIGAGEGDRVGGLFERPYKLSDGKGRGVTALGEIQRKARPSGRQSVGYPVQRGDIFLGEFWGAG